MTRIDVPEVGLAPVVVGERRVVHDLEEQVVDVGVRLLDLVEQEDRVGLAADRVGEQAALVEADVARGRADEPRDGVLLLVLGHVEAEELDAEDPGELLRDLRLADAGGAGEEEAAGRLLRAAEAGAPELDGRGDGVERRVLAEDDLLQLALEVLQRGAVVGGDGPLGDPRHPRHDPLDVPRRDPAVAPLLGAHPVAGARLVEDVDRLVRQLPVGDVLRRELGRRAQRLRREDDAVVLLVGRLEAAEDLHRLLDRRLVHLDLLEPAREGVVLLEGGLVVGPGGRADAAQLAATGGPA